MNKPLGLVTVTRPKEVYRRAPTKRSASEGPGMILPAVFTRLGDKPVEVAR